MRWRRRVESDLDELGITFTQWQVLAATQDLIRETGDAVNQNEVSQRAELDRMTVSQVMGTLARKSWVSRGPDPGGRGYRIFVTRAGRDILKHATTRAESVTASQGSG